MYYESVFNHYSHAQTRCPSFHAQLDLKPPIEAPVLWKASVRSATVSVPPAAWPILDAFLATLRWLIAIATAAVLFKDVARRAVVVGGPLGPPPRRVERSRLPEMWPAGPIDYDIGLCTVACGEFTSLPE